MDDAVSMMNNAERPKATIICIANTPNLVNSTYAIRGPAYAEKIRFIREFFIEKNYKTLNVLEILSDGENFE